jgi:hypothetical protein
MTFALLTALILSLGASASEPYPQGQHAWLDERLADLSNRKELVFASRCMGSTKDKQNVRTTLLLVPALDTGYLVEEIDERAPNVSSFQIKGWPKVDLETNGGLASMNRVSAQVEALLEGSFKLRRPLRTADWASIPSSGSCLPL